MRKQNCRAQPKEILGPRARTMGVLGVSPASVSYSCLSIHRRAIAGIDRLKARANHLFNRICSIMGELRALYWCLLCHSWYHDSAFKRHQHCIRRIDIELGSRVLWLQHLSIASLPRHPFVLELPCVSPLQVKPSGTTPVGPVIRSTWALFTD
jgi:hypothetical protein